MAAIIVSIFSIKALIKQTPKKTCQKKKKHWQKKKLEKKKTNKEIWAIGFHTNFSEKKKS